MIAWLLAAASVAATAYLTVCACRVWLWGRLQEIVLAWCIVGVSVAVTALAVFVALCQVRASA